MDKREIEAQRLANVNEFIRVIGSCGREFFHHKGRFARMELDERGRVWFVDYYTGKRIYTHYRHEWQGFTSGGTLRRLVELFRDHIKKGARLNTRYFDVNDIWCSGHPWGYPHEDYITLRRAAQGLGIMATPDPESDDGGKNAVDDQ